MGSFFFILVEIADIKLSVSADSLSSFFLSVFHPSPSSLYSVTLFVQFKHFSKGSLKQSI